jgi:hypothetical protein
MVAGGGPDEQNWLLKPSWFKVGENSARFLSRRQVVD